VAFGLQITGKDSVGNFLVTDTTANFINLPIIAQGAGSSVTVSSVTKKPYVFVNARGVSNQANGLVALWNNSTKTFSFYSAEPVYPTPSTGDIALTLTAKSVNYFVIAEIGETPAGTQGYGLMTFTASGAVAVDSRRYPLTSTYYISEIGPANALNGNWLTSDSYAYVDMSWSAALDGNGLVYYRGAKFETNRIEAATLYSYYAAYVGGEGGSGGDYVEYATFPFPLPAALIAKLR